MKPCYLIDASIYIFRAYFSLPESLVDRNQNPINAVYGFARFLGKFLQHTRPEYIAVAFDESLTTSFRNEIYPEYKANRELPPPALEAQLKSCRLLADVIGLSTYASERYEADDLIGTLAAKMRRRGHTIHIVSSDKDLAQLICNRDTLWDYARERRFRVGHIRERFGVHPVQMADYLALIGDPTDNIPGVPGIGAKTAAALLVRFRTIDNLYSNLDKIAALSIRGAARIREGLIAHKEQLAMTRKLTRIITDAPLKVSAKALRRKPVNRSGLHAFCDELGSGQGLRRLLLPS